MDRRSFIAALAGLPFLGAFAKQSPSAPAVKPPQETLAFPWMGTEEGLPPFGVPCEVACAGDISDPQLARRVRIFGEELWDCLGWNVPSVTHWRYTQRSLWSLLNAVGTVDIDYASGTLLFSGHGMDVLGYGDLVWWNLGGGCLSHTKPPAYKPLYRVISVERTIWPINHWIARLKAESI